MPGPWLGIAMVLAIFGGLLAGLRVLQALACPHPELLRKFLHIGMGMVTLSFPWLFEEAWPVVLLAALSVGLLLALRWVRHLKESLGSVISGVGRVSLGEIYFPAAVALLFFLFLHEPTDKPELRLMLYCIPLLILALADAAAALVGIRYGRWHYPTADGEKSAEGSLGFFLAGFFSVHVPLLLFTDVGRAETLLIALLLAWLAMMFEAISWAGLDNLLLPLVTFLLLKIYWSLETGELIARLIVTALLTVFLILYRHQTTLVGSAVLGAVLVGYVVWALGGWHWVLAPFVLFLTYTLLSPKTDINTRRIHNIHAVICVASAGLVWLFLARVLDRPDFLYPYTLSFAAQLAIIGIARLRFDYPQMATPRLLIVCIGKGWLFVFLPYLLAEGVSRINLHATLLALGGVAGAALIFYGTQPGIDDCPIDLPRWLRQAACAGLASLVGLVPLQAS